MLKQKLIALICSFILILPNALQAKFYDDIYEAAIEAQREAKLMVFFVLSDTCGFCHKLMNDVVNNQVLMNYLDKNFVVTAINLNAGGIIPQDLIFNSVTPTIYILTPTGKVIGQPIEGAIESNMLYELIKGLEEFKKSRLGF